MCVDPTIEYCKNFNCEKHFECHAIFTKANEERHRINLSVPKTTCGALRNMRVKPESPLRRNSNLIW